MYHSHCLRTGRYSATGHIYLITINCKARAPVFAEFHTARCFVHALQEAQLSCETLAYVLMPDHVHWLMQLKDEYSLSESVRFVKSRTTSLIHKASGYHIDFWQSGFHDRQLRQEDNLVHLARYVVANPVRAGLVHSVRGYPLWDAVWI